MSTRPDIEAQAVVMLEAGHTMVSVAKRLDLSLSTVKRIKRRRGVKAGAVTQEMIDAHRAELRKSLDEDWIKEQAAALVDDELALAHELRERVLLALEKAPAPDDMRSWGMHLRGLTAASTALKNSSDVLHRAIGYNRSDGESESLPELVVRSLTDEEVKAIKAAGAAYPEEEGQSDEVHEDSGLVVLA